MKRRDFLAQGGAIGLPLQAQALAQTSPQYSGKPALKKVVVGGIVVGHTVNDWAHAKAGEFQDLVAEARTEATGAKKPRVRKATA